MHTISIDKKEEMTTALSAERDRAMHSYYNCLNQLDMAVNKGTAGLPVSSESSEQITYLVRETARLKKKIQEINSSLLVLETGNYGVCVKTGKFILPEWPMRLFTAN
ncbi:MAG: hypothetical protein K0S12_701 [Bacteroidetes bacterium]|nr:hypothetical protein [Bacteroidota bacterium]